MAVRVHVVAARNMPPDQLQTAFAPVGRFDVAPAGEWSCFTASVWGVDSGRIVSTLQTLPGPALFATTVDGAFWRLSLFVQRREPYTTTHYFSALHSDDHAVEHDDDDEDGDFDEDAEEDDPDVPEFFRTVTGDEEPESEIEAHINDLVEMGCKIPEEIQDRLIGLGDDPKSFSELSDWLANDLADALERHAIPHDRAEIVSILQGTTVTDSELQTDIGNLPRFLIALGLGAVFQPWLDNQLAEYEADEEETRTKLPDRAPVILENAGDLAAERLRGEPLVLPAERLRDLLCIVRFCDERSELLIQLSGPGLTKVESAFAPYDEGYQLLTVRWNEDTLRIAIQRPREVFSMDSPGLRNAFSGIPNGTSFDLITAGPEATAGRHRYIGTVQGGAWRIESAFPAVSGANLQAALDLCAGIHETGSMRARDAAEADRVQTAAADHFVFTDEPLRGSGLDLDCDAWQREWLTLFLFRERFRQIWNVAEAEAEQEALDQSIKAAEEQLLNAVAAPATGEVIVSGQFSDYLRGEPGQLPDPVQKSMRETDAEFDALGFSLLGDLICVKIRDVILRGYVGPDGTTYGVQYLNKWSQIGREFFTPFVGGGSLTTTTADEQRSNKKQRRYFKWSEATDLSALLAEHAEGLRILAKSQLQPNRVPPTLKGLAAILDAFLLAQSKSA